MKKIDLLLKVNTQETELIYLRTFSTLLIQFVIAKGMDVEYMAWSKNKLKEVQNGLQGNEEGRENADERKDGSCGCGEGSCCKEGKEEVKAEGVD